MVSAASLGDARVMEEAVVEIEATSNEGHVHARSVLGFLSRMGMMRERNKVARFLFFCLGLIFMFFDSVVVIWGFFFFKWVFFLCLFAKKIYGFEG